MFITLLCLGLLIAVVFLMSINFRLCTKFALFYPIGPGFVNQLREPITTSPITESTVFLMGLLFLDPLLLAIAFFFPNGLTEFFFFFPLVYRSLLIEFCLAISLNLTTSQSPSEMGVSWRINLVVKIEKLND